MTIREDLFVALGPLFDGRLFPIEFPQSPYIPIWPAARYTIVSAVPSASVCGDSGDVADYLVQIDVVAATYDEGVAKAAAVRAAMATFEPVAVMQTFIEQSDPETATWRTVLDYSIGYSSPAEITP